MGIKEDKIIDVEEETKVNKLHLYIPHFNISLGALKKLRFPIALKRGVKAILEIISNIALLGIAGGAFALLLLLLLPFPEGMELVWIVKHNAVVSTIILFLGSGAGLYLLYDVVELFKKEKVGK